MAECAPIYDVGVIRRLLVSAFEAEDLKRFCEDHPILANIVPRFGPGYGLDDMVEEVIAYCQVQLTLGDLLDLVKQENPRQFARFEPLLHVSTELPSGNRPAEKSSIIAPQAGAQRRSLQNWRPWMWGVGTPLVVVAMVLGTWWLASHGRASRPTPTPSPSPTATAVPSLVPSVTPLPEPYKDIWQALGEEEGPLGAPSGMAVSRRYSVQEFEHGMMFFRDNRYHPFENWIYVIYWGPGDDKMTGSSWNRYVDTWLPGDSALSCSEAAPFPLGPTGGFGLVWCEHAEVRMVLGSALQKEENVKGGWLDFGHGVMLHDTLNKRVVVLYENQHWRAFTD